VLLIALSVSNTLGSALRVEEPEPGSALIVPARGIDVVEIDGEMEIVADRITINCVAP
jgi:hypothetical protein